jgi:hypothetical protein
MTRPAPLPSCAYPTAADVSRHGIQPLPDRLPVADLTDADGYPVDGDGTTSRDGFISDKDGGCMYYLLRLA